MRYKFILFFVCAVTQVSVDQKLKSVDFISPALAVEKSEEANRLLPDNELKPCEPPSAELQNLVALHNLVRQQGVRCGRKRKASVNKLQYSCLLSKASQAHSNDMSQNGFLSHIGSDGSGIAERADRIAYQWRALGENIAQGFTSAQSVNDSWLKSKAHCNNIMNPDFTEMGAALVNGYWTVTFAGQ